MPTAYEQFDYLSKEIAEARAECHRLYVPWQTACEKLSRLEKERNRAWGELVESSVKSAHSKTNAE